MTKPQPSPSLTTGGEIQPCRFCGEAKRLSVGPGSAQQTTFVMCMRCGASGPNSWGHENNVPFAITAWNRSPPLLREEVGEGSLAMTPASSLSSGGRPPVAKTTA